jgi:hypothetical protein
MVEHCKSYLKRYFDDFRFFLPECHDKRSREINMRTKRCIKCAGLEDCRMYPNFWAAGESDRLKMNDILRDQEPPAPEEEPAEQES